jgi:hypothetical protein
MPTPSAPALFHALHPRHTPERRTATLRVPRALPGMGALLGFEVGELADPARVAEWHFDAPMPRLAFEHVSPDASAGRRISRLWVVGGSYHVDARGRFHGGGRRGRMRVARAGAKVHAETAARYRATHGGKAPRELVEASVAPAGAVIPLGWCRAVIYKTDKAENAPVDPASYRHPFAEHARPLLCVDSAGTQILLLSDRDIGPVSYQDARGQHAFEARQFGRYTVTPHGVEDIA